MKVNHKIENVSIEELVALPGNARDHTPEQVSAIAESMSRYGWVMPILIDEDNMIIAGHGRVMAGFRLNMESVPCIRAENWSENDKKAYSLVDNRVQELSTWDVENLERELSYLEQFQINAEDLWLDPSEAESMVPQMAGSLDIGDNEVAWAEEAQAELSKMNANRDLRNHRLTCPNCWKTFEGR